MKRGVLNRWQRRRMVEMTHMRFFQMMWFMSDEERHWFKAQYSLHYSAYHRAVVLFALRRLSSIFKSPLTTLDGGLCLRALFDSVRAQGQSRFMKAIEFLTPVEVHWNPMQTIVDDLSEAEDACEDCFRDLPRDANEWTVADYVGFIAEFDKRVWNLDRLRVLTYRNLKAP
jgi:hypothetical protein